MAKDNSAGLILLLGLGAYLLARRGTAAPLPPVATDTGGTDADNGGIIPFGNTAQAGIEWVAENYGADYAREIERLFRLETAHFGSEQWTRTNTPGMVAFGDSYPYGWTSLATFAELFPSAGISADSTGVERIGSTDYVRLPDPLVSVLFVAWFLDEVRNGNVAAWYSLDAEAQARYRERLDGVATPIVDGMGA